MPPSAIPSFPRLEAIARADGSGELIINGTSQPVETGSLEQARQELIRRIVDTATKMQRPVRVATTSPDGQWPIIVHPDGRIEADHTTPTTTKARPAEPAPRHTIDATERSRTEPMPSTKPTLSTEQAEISDPASIPEPVPSPHGLVGSPPAPLASARSATTPPSAHRNLNLPGPARNSLPGVPTAPPAVFPDRQGISHQPNAEAIHQPAGAPQHQPQPGAQQSVADAAIHARQSFLRQEAAEEPATTGWRGAARRVGLRLSPSQNERAERADAQAVSQHWPGPRTIAVVNGKGGASKTPTTILLGAVFARYGGAGVLAWDNNQTRGTLGWRTEQGPHQATLLDLLPQTDRLLSTGAQSADLAHYVHHQTRDKYDVLRSKPMLLPRDQRIEPADVDAIWAVAAKYYRLILIDSGNDESDPMWGRMIDRADQIVVATTTRNDHAEAGALLLEALSQRDEHSAELARNSVAIISQADPTATPAVVRTIAQGYHQLSREVVTIPHDPAMVDGLLLHSALRANTQRAWLAAGAAVAHGL